MIPKKEWEEAIAGEGWAINDYTMMLESATPEEKKLLEHIIKEEKEHLQEIMEHLKCMNPKCPSECASEDTWECSKCVEHSHFKPKKGEKMNPCPNCKTIILEPIKTNPPGAMQCPCCGRAYAVRSEVKVPSEMHPFTESDWDAFAGAENYSAEKPPYIGFFNVAVWHPEDRNLFSQSLDSHDPSLVTIVSDKNGVQAIGIEYWMTFSQPAKSFSDHKEILSKIQVPINYEQLKKIGFK